MDVGLHARNAVRFTDMDYQIFRQAKIEMAVMMSFTDNDAFNGLLGVNKHMKFIVRLYDDRINRDGPVPQEAFVERMSPDIERLRNYTNMFQIHNEPNHVGRIEGWGSTDSDAYNFAHWYKNVFRMLKQRHPWALFGFPGLALNWPHRDLPWLHICQNEIHNSDWLGCHCYWQYDNMYDENWGMRFTQYHSRFPNKKIHITEFGNSTPGLQDSAMAAQYSAYYRELKHYNYIGSASSFIATSPDPTWAPFCWGWENGRIREVVQAVGGSR